MNENDAFLRKYISDPISELKEWLTYFGKVLVNPGPPTFREIAARSAGKIRLAVAWLVIFCCLLYLFSVLTSGVVLSAMPLLLFMFLTPTVLLFWVFCIHLVYGLLFHGDFNLYGELVCTAVCVLIPLNLVRAILLLIPIAGPVLSWLTFVYQGILAVIAVYAITRIRTLQAILVVVLGSIIAAGVIYLLSIFMLRLASASAMLF